MIRFSVRKNWKVRQVSRVGTVASLVFCLVVRAQADSTARATQQHKGSSKTAQTAPAAQTFTLVGAGDIAACQHLASAQATARLIAQIPGTVFAAGDLAYEQGSPDQFRNCYDKTWGEFKDRTKPALGNHEYGDRAAAGYFVVPQGGFGAVLELTPCLVIAVSKLIRAPLLISQIPRSKDRAGNLRNQPGRSLCAR